MKKVTIKTTGQTALVNCKYNEFGCTVYTLSDENGDFFASYEIELKA